MGTTATKDWDTYYKPQIDKYKTQLQSVTATLDSNRDGKLSPDEMAKAEGKTKEIISWLKSANEAKSIADAKANGGSGTPGVTEDGKVQAFNVTDEYNKWLASKDENYWKTLDASAHSKVDPYYDSMKQNLSEQLGIDTSKNQIAKENNANAYNNSLTEISRMTEYAKGDFARSMAKSDRAFASTMQRATDAYGQRGLLNSGVSAYGNTLSAQDQSTDEGTMKAGLENTMAQLNEARTKAQQSYELNSRSNALTDEQIALNNKQDQAKLDRARASELEVARENLDTRNNISQLGDLNRYAQQAGAIPGTSLDSTGKPIAPTKSLAVKNPATTKKI